MVALGQSKDVSNNQRNIRMYSFPNTIVNIMVITYTYQ